MKQLTKTQAAALQLIAENPGRVIAWVRTQKDFLRINGNVENALFAAGLIVAKTVGTRTYQGQPFELKVWTLAAPADEHAATRAEGRRNGMTEAQIDAFIARMA